MWLQLLTGVCSVIPVDEVHTILAGCGWRGVVEVSNVCDNPRVLPEQHQEFYQPPGNPWPWMLVRQGKLLMPARLARLLVSMGSLGTDACNLR
jgi:hypothetical protein